MNAFILVFCYGTLTAYSGCMNVVVQDETACTEVVKALVQDDKAAKVKSCKPIRVPSSPLPDNVLTTRKP